MEAGDSAAGDGDEQGREEACVAVEAAPACEGGQINVSAGEENTDDSNDHHAVEQEGAEVVTRLEQHPDRKQRSKHDVNCDEEDPEGTAAVDTEVQTCDNDGNDADDTDDGSGAYLAVLAVDEVAEDKGDNDKEQRGSCGRSVAADVSTTDGEQRNCGLTILRNGDEGTGDNCGEGSDNENKNEQCEDGEQPLCLDAHAVLDDLADGAAVVTDRGEQSTEVMHCAEEDTADDNPQENGNPAEDSGLNRSVNGAGAGDGREMMSHQDGGVGRNEVLSVVTGVCRGFTIGIHAPFLCKEATVEDVATCQQGECDDENKNCAHTFHSLKNVLFTRGISSSCRK